MLKCSTTRSKKNQDHTTHRSEDIERNIGVEGKHIMVKILGSAQESKNECDFLGTIPIWLYSLKYASNHAKKMTPLQIER